MGEIDGGKPGSLAAGALGIGMSIALRSPADKRTEADRIVGLFQEGKINDLEMFKLLSNLLGRGC